MKKKFSICFSGQPRCIEPAYDDFKKLFSNIDYDIFAHIWQSNNLLSSWGNNMGWENTQSKFYTAQDFVDLYLPTDYVIEDYDQSIFAKNTSVSPGYRNPVNKVWSSYSQFYSIKRSFEVMRSYQEKNDIEYEYTIKYRMDHDVDFEVTDTDISKITRRLDDNPNLILVNPGYDWPNGHGVSNLFAIGKTETMVKYSLLFDYFPWLQQNCPYTDYDEAKLKMYLEKICGLEVKSDAGISVGVYR
jgi:hypothetical protein